MNEDYQDMAQRLKWLTDDHTGKEELDSALKRIWDSVPECPEEDTLESLQTVLEIIKPHQEPESKRTRKSGWMYGFAAMLLLLPALCGLSVKLNEMRLKADNELVRCVVQPGMMQRIVLPDGTNVTLNAGSFLSYPRSFRNNDRLVNLVGEASFDVAHDAEHPFIVQTPKFCVKALGTKFSILADQSISRSTTTLEEGKVEISSLLDPEKTFILHPDEQFSYDSRLKTYHVSRVNSARENDWTSGALYFNEDSLNEILEKVGRMYGRTIVNLVSDDDSKYTMSFPKGERFEKIMDVISMTVGNLEVLRKDDSVIVMLKK
ncbi:MAG: FecR domain-containing protein [Bacteroidales bacterium]|nr:FecR domain-containing protein [Bacteroidales bacterium]